jgi:hypothetical protein
VLLCVCSAAFASLSDSDKQQLLQNVLLAEELSLQRVGMDNLRYGLRHNIIGFSLMYIVYLFNYVSAILHLSVKRRGLRDSLSTTVIQIHNPLLACLTPPVPSP